MEKPVFGRSVTAAVHAGVHSPGGAGSLPLDNPFQQSPARASHCQQDLSQTKQQAEDGREEPVTLVHCMRKQVELAKMGREEQTGTE